MRKVVGAACLVAGAVGFAAGRMQTANAANNGDAAVVHDEHDAHDSGVATSGFVQPANLPASASTAADRLANSPRHAEWVAVKVNATDSVLAWVVYPERKEKAPVVIAIHENTGLNTWTRAVADQLAAEGFIGIAPDLTTMKKSGDLKADPTPDAGRAAIGQITPDMGNEILDAVAKYGMSLPAAEQKYGIIGFCWGGGRSFLHATHSPSLGASVVFYGSPPRAGQMQNIRAPVLGLYGGDDARINATIPATDSLMKQMGKSYQYHIYDGAGHGFLRAQEQREANLAASRQAWPTMVAFLREKLGQ